MLNTFSDPLCSGLTGKSLSTWPLFFYTRGVFGLDLTFFYRELY